MSDFGSAVAISASGMALERLRVEVAATNLANAHTTHGVDGRVYQPLRVIAHASPSSGFGSFESHLSTAILRGVGSVEIRSVDTAPRLERDPGHPDADERGFVALPQIDPVEETITLRAAVRAYEANVRALNAAKAMAQRALEIGSNR